MRFIFKLLVAIVLVLGVGNYLVYLKTGQFPVSTIRENYKGDWLAAIKESFAPGELISEAKKTVDDLTREEPAKPAPTKVYKWTDANGQVHYGDRPDSAGAEQVEVKIQNAISAPDQPAPAVEKVNGVSPQSPLDKARAAAKSMESRVREQEAN
jgi:hypothetical protein